MYEPIRTKSVHSMAADTAGRRGPHRSRTEELDIRLAGHLTALLTVTDELRSLVRRHEGDGTGGRPETGPYAVSGAELDRAADRIAEQVARLRGGRYPLRAEPTGGGDPARVPALHRRARTLAGNALAVATARGDAAAIALTSERMEAHTAVHRNLAATA
ncbi:hypothetical protein [Streptomyces sp. MST-110588]|uniref:SCO4983 family protein n=1 Tax=Streptomyces sp. MST-110588 TaxID=2833628 RepID=UPI001F5DA64A|nr:hypothetical protein [Streptomyces sp. MST-110588]UNO40183.1 hypothetical protein KGS77_12030 [Streptomyces sp. MST-110588]